MRIATSKRRAVLYGRTSQDDSDGRSVDDQLSELRKWAERTGREIVAELRDDGVSASRYAGHKKTRPDWQVAMELITTGQADELAVWEISRSTRDRAVWAALIAACIEHGVDLAVDGKVHDPADPDDGFMLDLGAALAVRESAVISKRTRRAVDSRAAAGRPHGSLLYGYRRRLDPVTGRTLAWEIDPAQGPVVAEVVRRLLARETAHAITADLTRRGILTKTGKPWRPANLVKMALRPTYAGLRVYHGEVLQDVEGTWPAIITDTDHYRLVEMFADPARDKWRNSTHVKHLGTGIFQCGREGCNGRMRVLQQGRGRPPAYTCRDCYRLSRLQQPVDQAVERLVVARLSQPDVLELLADTSEDDDVKAAAAEVVRLKRQLRELREKVDADELSLDDLAYFRPKWEKQLADAEQRARPRWIPSVVYEVAGPDAANRWKMQHITAKRQILNALFTVTIRPAGRWATTFDPNLIEVSWRGAGG